MHPLMLMLLTFLAVALAILGVYSFMTDLFLRDRSRSSELRGRGVPHAAPGQGADVGGCSRTSGAQEALASGYPTTNHRGRGGGSRRL